MNNSRSKEEPVLVFDFFKWVSDELFLLPFSSRLIWKHIEDIIILEMSSKSQFYTLQQYAKMFSATPLYMSNKNQNIFEGRRQILIFLHSPPIVLQQFWKTYWSYNNGPIGINSEPIGNNKGRKEIL
jgi:hypothetical protein